MCNPKIDLRRVLDLDRLVTMCPINLQDVVRRDGLFMGLNAINDNLVLLNRRNNTPLSGIIAGVAHSGKTYQCKQEIFNALISTDDDIAVVAFGDEYDAFVKKMGGDIAEGFPIDPFRAVNGYAFQDRDGEMEDNAVLKSYFLDALFGSTIKVSHNHLSHESDETNSTYAAIEDEVAILVQKCLINSGSDNVGQVAREYISSHVDELPVI